MEVLVYPVGELYYAVPRNEDGRATVLAAGSGLDVVELVTRLSVLLNGRDERVCFKWLGPPGNAVFALQAAGVQVGLPLGDAEHVRALSGAWVFMHVFAEHRMPFAAAQAMAAGVPCLVSDTPAHRALIRHGETGFICAGARDFLEKLVLLMRDPAERERIGDAARADARRRLASQQFERALFRAYGFSGVAAPRPRRLEAVHSLEKEDTP